MHTIFYFIVFLVLTSFFWQKLYSQEQTNKQISYRLVFYNLENYFDVFTDTILDYNEYTPNGDMRWDEYKFVEKTKNLYKVFQALSSWDGISLAGVCEIENAFVLNNLLYNTPLKKYSYKYIHFDSHDNRGIDVALIYGSEFDPIYSTIFSIKDNENNIINTRDILYVKGLLSNDTIHVFINHWTSRYRGLLESNSLRMKFSNMLKSKTDSISTINKEQKIIVMGDFNDQFSDESMINLTDNGNLINLNPTSSENKSQGTLKYKSDWFTFDQVLVSTNLTNNKGLTISVEGLKIFDAEFILEKDEKYLGYKPFRTNIGFKYNAGYSDHLPIYFDLKINK